MNSNAFDLSTLKDNKVNPNEPMMRLLICAKCKTIEEVPAYEGPEGGENTVQYDHSLRFFIDQHIERKCTNADDRRVGHLPTKYWVIPKVKESIIQQLQTGSQGLDVFGTQFYATKENFTSDAMTCWIAHKQTKDCGDYKSEKKLLTPDTAKERKEAGLDKAGNGPKVYLCDYCPVKSVIQEKAYKKKGLYN
jgi:hypothetical protein